MDNKRKSRRIAKKIKSQVSAPDSHTYSTTHNLSDGGMFISTPDPIAPGTELELSLKLPNGEFMNVTGIVRWTRDEDPDGDPAGMGIEFASITDSEVNKIKKILE